MKIIIVGGGRLGYAIARQLLLENHDITVIEPDSRRAEFISTSLDVIVLEGRATIELLCEAGAANADLLIAATMSDETNLISCAVGRKLGARHTIARVREEEYYQDMLLLRDEMGLSLSINPERTAAKEISRILRFPVATKVEPFANGLAELVEYHVGAKSKLCGVQLQDFRTKISAGVLVTTLERGGKLHIPNGDYVLEAGDDISLVGSPHELHALFKRIGEFTHEVQGVMLIGGSRIAERLTMELTKMRIRTIIVEQNEKRCIALKDALPEATVIWGDAAQPNLLREEGLLDTDALVALTDSDAMNLVLSSLAQSEQVPKVVTKLNEENYVQLAEQYGVTTTIQPAAVTASRITEYIRAMQNSADVSGVETLRLVAEGRAEALGFVVRASSPVVGVPLKDLKLKPSVLVAAVIRGSECFIPGGNDSIRPDDRVVVITIHHGMRRIEDLLTR